MYVPGYRRIPLLQCRLSLRAASGCTKPESSNSCRMLLNFGLAIGGSDCYASDTRASLDPLIISAHQEAE